MNANCIICSDLFTPSAEIYTTNCGHIFHYTCLIQWIERSRSCPQCRSKATEKTIHRIYFNITNSEGIADDASTLQFKLDNMQFQLRLKDTDIKNYTEKYEKSKHHNVELRKEVRGLEHEVKVKESAMHALKEQISYFKQKSKEGEKLTDEVIRLKERLKSMEDVQIIVSGSREDANDMLRHNRDPHSLALMASTLKKELVDADRKKKQMSHSLKHLQNDVTVLQREASQLKAENSVLKQSLEGHKNCEAERKYLKRKITELENRIFQNESRVEGDAVNTSVNRIIMESPAPLRRPHLDESSGIINFDNYESPSLQEKVKHTLDSDSPYLPLKSSSVGISSLVDKQLSGPRETNKFSIFKPTTSKVDDFKIPRKDYVYDGFGGHTKLDKFPSPNSNAGCKRPRSSSSIPSNKFRKLAPNKNLKQYFHRSNET